MSTEQERATKEAVAWLDQWLTQGTTQLGSLYETVHDAITGNAWPPDTEYHRDTMMTSVAKHFGLTAPPNIPARTDLVAVAGIFDRMNQLRITLSEPQKIQLDQQSQWDPEKRELTVPPELLARQTPLARLEALVGLLLTGSVPAQEAAYAGLLKDLFRSGLFGGP